MRRRSAVLTAALAVAAAVLPAPAASAAATQCSLVLPTRVVVNATSENIPVRLSSNCTAAGADVASWHLMHRSGSGEWADFADGDTSMSLPQLDSDPIGSYVAYPAGAAQADGDPLTQNTPKVSIKYGGKLTVGTTRSGNSMTWRAYAYTWSGRTHGWYRHGAVTVSLWYKAPGSSTWSWVKASTTDREGKTLLSLAAMKYGSYRLGVSETATTWEFYSMPVPGRIDSFGS